jgi:tetratricopeptide (TPR) repeat protein
MSDEQHLHRMEIVACFEGAVDETEKEQIAGHIQRCVACFKVYEEVAEGFELLKDGEVVGHVEDDAEATDDFVRGLLGLQDQVDSAERDGRAADALLVRLAQQPVERWEAIIGENPHTCTSALVRRLVNAAEPEIYRQPEHAHILLRIAESIANGLRDEPESFRARGLVWRQRAIALRIQTRYEEALDAAIIAKSCYGNLRDPDTPFDIGQVYFTIAATLFEMTRFAPAFREVTTARELLAPYGLSAPLARVMMLEALILAERGDVANARQTLLALLPIEEQLGQPLEAGLVRTNLAECNLRLGDLDAAMEEARAAIGTFRALGNIAHETRGEWTVAMIRLARGDKDAIDRLHDIAAIYRNLGMPGEAGFVNLDVTAELLEREEWTAAAILARELVTLFSAAGVTLASVNALHYLRRAVENREATPETVRYVRSYIAADKVADREATRPFSPPP